jgi:DNA helicase-2/ATP-dependent DNA helicase PcrA
VLDNPLDEIAWRRLWLMIPRIGNASAARLWQFISQRAAPFEAALEASLADRLASSARTFFQRFQKDLRELARAAQDELQPSALIHAVLETGYADYLRTQYGTSQARLEDIQQLAVFARSYRTLRSLLSELVLLGELYGREAAGAGSTDEEGLVLSSVHQAKGLEWRVVFVIRMCEGAFPADVALRETGGEEEERRVFYVATTRAKDELYLTYPLIDLSLRGNSQLLLQPSRFLREIRHTLYEHGQVEEQPEWKSVDGLSDSAHD